MKMANETRKKLTTEDNHKIAYAHYEAGHNKAIIIAPGFFNSKDAALLKGLKNRLIDSYDVVMFDFRGHGESSGLYTWTAKENLDLEKIIDHTKAKYSKIGLIGFSFGAAISIQVTAKDKNISSLISISAPYDAMKINYQFWDLDIENDIIYNLHEGRAGKGVRPGPFWYAKKKPIDLVEKIMCPILYIHGDRDWVIRHTHSQKLYEKTKSKKKIAIIKNGPHAEYLLRKNYSETINLIQEWLRETL